jgi:hypothetical protein
LKPQGRKEVAEAVVIAALSSLATGLMHLGFRRGEVQGVAGPQEAKEGQMKHTQVESSNVHSIGHDPEKMLMEVTFKNGGTYVYSDVSVAAFAGLLLAPSVGSHLHQHFKGKHREFRKVE